MKNVWYNYNQYIGGILMFKNLRLIIGVSIAFSSIFLLIYCGDNSVNPMGGDTGVQDVAVRQCKNNAQCLADEECKNNICVKKETTICRNNTDCKANQDCINGKCVDIVEDAGLDGSLDIGDNDVLKRGKISSDPPIVDFGAMRFGERKEKVVRIKNIGNADLKVIKIELDPNADSKVFDFKTDFKVGSFLGPNEEFEITVSCQQNDEALDSGDLLISSDDMDTPILRVKMKNSYKDEPDLIVKYIDANNNEITYPDTNSVNNELTIDMGNIPLGEKKRQVVSIQNVAEESIVKISEIKYDIYNYNSTNINKFSARLKDKEDGNEVELPVYLSPSDSVVLEVEYSADNEAINDKYDISILTNDLDVNNDKDKKENGLLIMHFTAMAGYRDPEIAILDLTDRDISASGIDFGEVEKSTSAVKVFKICNRGGGVLEIDKASGLVNGNFTIEPSSLEASLKYNQCINNIQMTFTPSGIGEVRDTLKVISNDKKNPTVEMGIRGLGINAEMRINPTSITFGDVLLNSNANPVNVEIKNIGDGTLIVYNISFSSGSSSDFSLSNLPVLPAKLRNNETTSFFVEFRPTSLGKKEGVVIIKSSDAENLQFELTVTGNGSNCDSNRADCNNDPSDGCEVDLRYDINNCGSCGNICNPANGNGKCENKKCIIESCKGTYLDCNNDVSDGCEADKLIDNKNCGGCFKICGDRSSCIGGTCICDSGYLNCDNDFSNGCEVDPKTNKNHCGECFNNCGNNALCDDGNCKCVDGFLNCDNSWSTGCEINGLNNSNNCGGCGNKCGSNAYCDNGNCKCNDGYGNCNGDWAKDGCEKYLMFDKNNCGQCFKVCQDPPNSVASCNMGSCVFTCYSGYKDCDGNPDNGCEANLYTDPNNCGVCGYKCGNNMKCENGICICKPGFADCNKNTQLDGCEVDLSSDSDNCGSCENKCNQNASCSSGSCTCNYGYANCDNNWNTGCEVDLSSDVYHCGSCSTNCSNLPNVASASCVNYSCVINSCNTDTANCDGNVSNGCEVNHNVYANSCATAENLGEMCGDNGTPSLGPVAGYGSKFIRFKVKECDSGLTADPLAAYLNLHVPPNVDYDLIAYFVCGGSENKFPKGPGIDEGFYVYKDDVQCWPGNCDDTFDVWVEIRYISGGTNQCGNWEFTTYSNDGWY
jgi:hypothetical protein